MNSVKLDPTKYGLALHTSSPELGLALNNFAGDSRFQIWDLGRDLSTHLHHHLAEFIQPQTWADLEFICVAIGPGSFTGTRIGVVTARTLAQQLNIPLFSVSTLASVAWSEADKSKQQGNGNSEESSLNNAIAVQLPAQRGQLFTAIYQVSPSDSRLTQMLLDSVMTPAVWQQKLDSWHPYQLIDIAAGAGLGGTVSSVLELAYLDWQQGRRPHWSEVLPFYGQHPVEEKTSG
ncbi:tRNA (adenosine(37)-N6)-threonylcarbamoyltransferase complex dimerization subunit type 1 TsaB [Coleofasciculus sp. FACHB-1120]|uniref:tRNA (adenosine(37)-N6)-threonylcarbamoyltransferase complex dimerization subunit type 1 TsaB n=1 Tax=Coleofasciculus sp. FACHB-1120 TaxID=2692783 RepID=UPI001687D70F|nr:tRNA (adenosine(37)-N6)-threonylcarbamoyltransferase complex dimerization subunit type 1 TsaB [Coleofasciculus sp. FACHB-1120]MBD2743409.1 tRNA (adenosine(37)-N6)-threonylcarbamoyltransferase complex dimerization subunit type 1 TsaB [Coleofasciculus sp. FACHB-1120]